jgi:hypothetical protein
VVVAVVVVELLAVVQPVELAVGYRTMRASLSTVAADSAVAVEGPADSNSDCYKLVKEVWEKEKGRRVDLLTTSGPLLAAKVYCTTIVVEDR